MAETTGNIAEQITDTFSNLGQLVTASAYLAGLGFSVASIAKFKAHKDNPTQIPIGTPIALQATAAALLFLPSILSIDGSTGFGETAASGDLTASDVTAAAKKAGITASDVESAAEKAGVSQSEITAAESALKSQA